MFEVIVLAVALSMDAFAVSIWPGFQGNVPWLGLKAGMFRGGVVLILIGIKMLDV